MSNVVPLRAYSYADWLDIAIKVDALRGERGQAPYDGTWALWKRFFKSEAQ